MLYAMQAIPRTNAFFANRPLRECGALDVVRTLLINPVPYQLWFLRDLYVFAVVAPLVYCLIVYIGLPLLVILGVLWISDIWPSARLDGLFFLLIGSWLALRQPTYRFSDIYVIIFSLCWLLIVTVNTSISVIWGIQCGALLKIAIPVGLMAFWLNTDALRRIVDACRVRAIVPYTFFLYAFHEPWLTASKKLWLKSLGQSSWSVLLAYLLCPIVVMAVGCLVAALLQAHAKRLYLVFTGGR